MTIQEIESKIQAVTTKQEKAIKEIDSLRRERAKLAVDSKGEKNGEEIGRIDHQVFKLELSLSNTPAELELLNSKLAAEQERVAEAERAALIESQHKIANDVETLSEKLVEHLKTANETNTLLRNALTSEANLRARTGQEILQRWCSGSMESLQKLTKTMQGQLDTGVHTHPVGPGIVRDARPLRL